MRAFFLLLIQVKQGFAVINFTINDDAMDKDNILLYGFSSPDVNLNNDILEIKNRIIKNLSSTNLVQFSSFKEDENSSDQNIFDIEAIPIFEKFHLHIIRIECES